jgi:hypothetical protein
MSNWDAMSIQLVWFTSEARQKDAANLYEFMMGQEPDSVQTSKAPTIGNPSLAVATGLIGSLQVRTSVQFGRVEFSLSPFIDENVSIPPLITDTDDQLVRVIGRARSAALVLPTINRLAMVVQLAEPMETYAQGFSLVTSQSGNPISFEDGSDFTFQVNRRKSFDQDDFILNRLMRFMVGAFQMVSGDGTSESVVAHDVFAAITHVDVNSVPTTLPIDPAKQERIWEAIGEEVLRIREIAGVEALS